MSIEAIKWANKQRIFLYNTKGRLYQSSSCQHLLNMLATFEEPDELNPDFSVVKVSVAELESVSGLERKTVLLHLKRLRDHKFIETTGQFFGKTGSIPVYKLKRTDADAIERADLQLALSAQASTGETRDQVEARAEIAHTVETRCELFKGFYPRNPDKKDHFKTPEEAEEADRLLHKKFIEWSPDDDTLAVAFEHITWLLGFQTGTLGWKDKHAKALPWPHTYIDIFIHKKWRQGRWDIPAPFVKSYGQLAETLGKIWPPEEVD